MQGAVLNLIGFIWLQPADARAPSITNTIAGAPSKPQSLCVSPG